MPVLVNRSSTRRRVLAAVGLVSVIAVIGVQGASGARTHAASSASTTGATGSSDTAGVLPTDQPALDAAAYDAQSVAGSAYYTDADGIRTLRATSAMLMGIVAVRSTGLTRRRETGLPAG